MAAVELPVLVFASAEAFATWLEEEPEGSPGLWLKIAKKGARTSTVTYDEALDVALCYGWIDGQKKGLDGEYWLQRFTPRKARSPWSQINCAKATALIESGLMRPAGLREVERAKADGRWESAYAGQRTIEVPPDLQAALGANPVAQAFFRTLDSTNRYAILYRIHEAKKPETRARRIQKYVAMLAEKRRIHP
jgi:uncharacterized protein YdeI (YjbR/CyaY-like superfamily)